MYILSSETQWYREVNSPDKKVLLETQPKSRHNHSTFYFTPEEARKEIAKVAHQIKDKVLKGEILQDWNLEEEYGLGVHHLILGRPNSDHKIQITVNVGVGMYTISQEALNILRLHGYDVGNN
jgi:hypothetical protein